MRIRIILIIILIVAIPLLWFFVVKKDGSNEVEEESKNISSNTAESTINRLSEIGESLKESDVLRDIVGTWQNLNNTDYTVEFQKNGQIIEKLGERVVSGEWRLVSFDEGPNSVIGTVSFSQDGVFLRQSLDEGKSHFYYKVVQADQDRLVTIYLHEGGILAFERIQSN